MKKLATLGIAMILLSSSAAWAITENQAMVAPLLKTLKLKPIASEVIGGPMQYEITDETIEHLTKAKKAGKVIVLKPNGSIELTKKK